MRVILMVLSLLLPWPLRRWLLQSAAGYQIHPSSRIGFSLVFPDELILEEGARIGHLNVCKGLHRIHLGPYAVISSLNWITGFPLSVSRHFAHQPDRMPQLILGEHAAVASRHLIDCTATVSIARFSTVGGFYSQILTHSVDIETSRQTAVPVEIGEYCFVGTNCVLLGGSKLPSHSILGAKSLLNKSWTETHQLYAGVPAEPRKKLEENLSYFQRETGFIW